MEENPGISLFQTGGLNIDSALQNQEEDEDLEEQRRRQEEIQSLLTKAMDEFNYDDQSTINSSGNVSVDHSYPVQAEDPLFTKYKNTNLDDQLKVLYEIRVKEIKELMGKVAQLEGDIGKQRETNAKKCILLEADKSKAQISLEQSQALLVAKSEEICSLNKETEHLKNMVNQLEKTVQTISGEYTICKQSNKELMDQLEIMHSGLTTNTISDRVLKEQHHAEISQMHHLLDVANTKLYRKEKECKEYEGKLKNLLSEKDQVVLEKSSVINRLTENLENAQQQCQDLLQIIDKISQENKSLKSSTNELQDSTRIMNLTEKMEYIGALQRELAKAHDKHIHQQSELENLQKTCKDLTERCKRVESEKEQYKSEIDTWKENYHSLEENFQKADEEIILIQQQIESYRGKLEGQEQIYEEEISKLKATLAQYEIKLTQDSAAQVSFSFTQSKLENDEKQQLREQLLNANEEITDLQLKLNDAEDQISKLQIASKLEKERESLVRNLQEKAAQFEKVIKERQKQPDRFSIGINTEGNTDVILLKEQYEAELAKREVELRVKLKNEFDQRLEKIEQELAKKLFGNEDKKCTNCEELTSKLRKLEVVTYNKDENISSLKLQMKQDRSAVAGLLESWRDKFMDMEIEKKELLAENLEIKSHCNELSIKLKSYDVGTSKLYHVIKSECEETIKLWNKSMVENLERYALAQKGHLAESCRRIDEAADKADAEIAAIEMKFLRKKQSLQNFQFTKH